MVNPATGEPANKNAVLGLNEKRIGDILARMGKADTAATAYKRARERYQQALAELDPDSIGWREARQELEAVPKP